MKKRIVSAVMALVLCLTLLPTAALGAEDEAEVIINGDSQSYATLQAAFDAVKNCTESSNASIKLMDNITLAGESGLTISGGVFTLDLNEKAITYRTGNQIAITMDDGTVTLTDSRTTDSGTIVQKFVMNGGTLNMQGGTIEKLYVNGSATLNASGGSISSNLVVGNKDGEINLSGGFYACIQGYTTTEGKKTPGDLLAQGYAYQINESLQPLNTVAENNTNKNIENVTVVKCPHTDVTSGNCQYCNTALTLSPVFVGGVQLLLDTNYINNNGSVEISTNGSCNAIVTGNDTDGYTLTINDLNVTGKTDNTSTKYKSAAIYTETDKPLTIFVEEASTVTGAQTKAHSAGVYAENDLTITGTGTLTATGGRTTTSYCDSYGIKCNQTLTMKDTTIVATGGEAGKPSGTSCGVFARKIAISGEDTVVTAAGGDGGWASYGIGSSESISLSSGRVEAQANGTTASYKKAASQSFISGDSAKEVKYTDESGAVETEYNEVSNKTKLTVTLGDPAPVSYTVWFYTYGGSLTGDGITPAEPNQQYTMQYQKGVGISELPKPTRDGYTFGGWYDKSDFSTGSGPIGNIGTGAGMNFTFYAKWLPNVAYVETAGEPPRTSYYASLADAIAAAQAGDTVGLLDKAGTANITSGSFTLDLNGRMLNVLNVGGSANIKLADAGWGTGSIGTISVTSEGGKIRDLCQEGYSLKIGGAWVTDEQLSGAELSGGIKVYAIPITGVTASTDKAELLYGYTDTATLSAQASMASVPGYDNTELSYQWYSVTGAGEDRTETPINGAECDRYLFPAGQSVGTYTYFCTAACDGYAVRSNDVTVTVKSNESTDENRTTVSFSGIEDNQTFVYDSTAKTPEGTLTVSDDVDAASLEVQYEKVENGIAARISGAPTDVGSYQVTYSVPDSNERYKGSVTYSFTITPSSVVITVKDQNMYIGAAVPTLDESSYTVSGLVGNDKLTTAPTLKYVDAAGKEIKPDTSKAGETIIRASNADAGANYEISYEDGTLTVSRRSSSSSGTSTLYPITVKDSVNGDAASSVKSASKGSTVTITVTPDKGYTLETLTVTDASGKELPLTDKGNGKYTFTMPASSVTIKAAFMDDNTMLNFFVDVKASDYYYDAVLWAAQKGITSGISATEFGPDQPCTRAQIVTFLWRAADSPEPKNVSSFADVSASSYYAKAVAWAVENGITTGTTATTFSPNSECTRAQAVTFLSRYAAPEAVTLQELVSGYADAASVPGYALPAMNWALASGIVQGDGRNLMANDPCTRAQIVTFLYRALEK